MQVTLSREKILKPLQMVLGVADKKHTMTILTCLLCEAKDNKFKVTASDLETEIVSEIDVISINEPGLVAIPAKKMVDIIKSLPLESEVELKSEGKNRMILTSNKSRFVLSILEPDSFPTMESDISSNCFELSQNILLDVIKKVQFSMAHNDVRYFLNGMLWEIDKNIFRSVSTDGHRMSMVETKINEVYFDKAQIIIPRKSISEIQKLIEPIEETIKIEIGTHHFRLVAKNTTFTSKLIDGRYPDYTRVLPTSNNKILVANKNDLKLSLTRTAILSNEKYRGVRFNIEQGLLKLSANNPEQEEAQDEISVEYQDLPMEIGFNVSYLLEVISVIESDKVYLCFSDPKMSLLIKEDGKYSSQFVIMPIRL
jgi:DNA polymerase-3 subunit beta